MINIIKKLVVTGLLFAGLTQLWAACPTSTSTCGTKSTCSSASTSGTKSTCNSASTCGTKSTCNSASTCGTKSTCNSASTCGTKSTCNSASTCGTKSTCNSASSCGTKSTCNSASTCGTKSTSTKSKKIISEDCIINANNDLDINVSSNRGTIVDVLKNDGCVKACGEMTFTQGMYGIVDIDDAGTPKILSDDLIIYVANNDSCNETDTFEYTLRDCNNNSSTATVTVNITCPNKNIYYKRYPQISNASAMNTLTLVFLMMFTGLIASLYIRRTEIKEK